MIPSLNPADFLAAARSCPVIDVRAPAEFAAGHIPGAVSLPLFDDEERAAVGTLYHRSGREASVLKGLDLAGPKLAEFLKQVSRLVPGKELLVHCWRGGMRSESMAWLFRLGGYSVSTLEGGYKAYRRHIRSRWEIPAKLIVLGGQTGSGKTELLNALCFSGEQVLNLEGVARHKGSVFGGLGMDHQPTNEQFENDLAAAWEQIDPEKRVWIEDESRMIGNVSIPGPLLEKMNSAVMIRIEIERDVRIRRLIGEYASFGPASLLEKTEKIAEKIGGTGMNVVKEALRHEDYATVAAIVLDYYDKAYTHAVSRRSNREVHPLPLHGDDNALNAMILLGYADSIMDDPMMLYGTSLS